MDRFLDFGIEILNAEGGAIETDLAQSSDVIFGQAARIDFDTGFDVFGESEMAMDDVAETADFVRRKESGRAAAPMELGYFAPRLEQCGHLRHFFFEIVDVGLALLVIEGDDGRAATKPAKSFAKGDVIIEREVAFGAIVFENTLGEVGPHQSSGKFGGRRVGGVA